jgi:hypothetical protein
VTKPNRLCPGKVRTEKVRDRKPYADDVTNVFVTDDSRLYAESVA